MVDGPLGLEVKAGMEMVVAQLAKVASQVKVHVQRGLIRKGRIG
jgi:hypothetical protein